VNNVLFATGWRDARYPVWLWRRAQDRLTKEEKMNTRTYTLTFVGAVLTALVGLSAAVESKEYLK
jgi:hypothetical protein